MFKRLTRRPRSTQPRATRVPVSLALALVPLAAHADWLSTLNQYGTNIRIGLYTLAGTLAIGSLIWSGVQWLIARAQGDRSHTFMDYVQQVMVIICVGASIAIGTAAWQLFGTGGTSSST